MRALRCPSCAATRLLVAADERGRLLIVACPCGASLPLSRPTAASKWLDPAILTRVR